jgi:hypothetical protein
LALRASLANSQLPLSKVLEGVSLNLVWLYKNPSSTTLISFTSIALALGGFNFAALTSKVAQ